MQKKTTRFLTKTQRHYTLLVVLSSALAACTSATPINPKGIEDACNILDTDSTWRAAFDNTYRKYGTPPHVVMAIIYQESRFVPDARPPKEKFLGIPTIRPSSAYGYAQALDPTWEWYQNKSGNNNADRDNFADAVDFIGWYIQTNYDRTGVSKWNAKDQYLAYHEGSGGYLNKSYNKKPWLIAVSDKVDKRAALYYKQLTNCYNFPALQ